MSPRSSRGDLWRCGVLAALGAWTTVVPFLGRGIGLVVDVSVRVEVVDHVVPGVTVAVIGTYLTLAAYGGTLTADARTIGGGLCFLAGFWVLATHVPLIKDAIEGKAAWGATLWHASTALPIVVLSLWIALEDR